MLGDMQFMQEYQFVIVAAIVIAGFVALGWIAFRMHRHMEKMSGGLAPSGDTTQDLVRRTMHLEARMDEVEPRLAATEAAARASIQKVGFLRFNPFQDTGGDNSFSVALLDSENNGVVISSLYMREGTRLYAKEVKSGTTRQTLSDEEVQVLDEAVHRTIYLS